MSRRLPDGFVSMLESLGREQYTAPLITALSDSEPSLAVRANTRRSACIGDPCDKIPWLADSGIYLSKRPNFALDPAWHQGLYYVQDASSAAMTAVVAEITNKYFDDSPLLYLDACAAPGGKSIAAAEALPRGSFLLSNEYDSRRASILAENIAKYGMANCAVANGDTSRLAALGEIFDIVAVDAPCSGEGMMRKKTEAIAQWSTGLVNSCARLQQTILTDCWKALRPGGVMIYSTCTFNRTEDEENLAFIIEQLGGRSIELPLTDYPGIINGFDTRYYCYRFMPGLVRGEGLFIAAVQKTDGINASFKGKKQTCIKEADAISFMRNVLTDSGSYSLRQAKDGSFYAIPADRVDLLDTLSARLRLISCGIPLGSRKGKDIIPAWQLAYSEALCNGAFPTLGLSYKSTLAYLHGDSLSDMPSDLPKGFILTTYENRPLGFIKNIGRRANNLYPDNLRLRLDPTKADLSDYIRIVKPSQS